MVVRVDTVLHEKLGLADGLVDQRASSRVARKLRHADVRTSLKVYAHPVPQSLGDAMGTLAGFQSLRATKYVTEVIYVIVKKRKW